MRVSIGKFHNYAGTNLDLWGKGEVKVTIIDYLKTVLNDFPEMITGSAITPVTTHLFYIRSDKERILLGKEQARAFHHSVVHLLFTSSYT
jgi:hypothetical protein